MFTSLIDLFYPKVCAGCNALLLQYENVICTKCRHEIPLTQHIFTPENEAFKKFYGKLPVENAFTFMYYHKKGIVQEMIHKLKYQGQQQIGSEVGSWFASEIRNSGIAFDFDVILPVPLHKRRFRERGYNQVTAFGNSLADSLQLNYNESILQRMVYSRTQTKKNLLGRTDVAKSIFAVNYNRSDCNKHFLIIDDVLTTGSTLESCGRAVLQIPGARISIACLAMSHS